MSAKNSAKNSIVSDIEVSDVESVETDTLKTLYDHVKTLGLSDLEKLIKFSTTQLVKVAKAMSKAATKPSVSKGKKEVKSSKKPIPRQLKKNNAWVKYVFEDAKENGWESFTISQNKKDKVTGKKSVEVVEMPESELINNNYYYKSDEAKKVTITYKHAMSLSKHYWSNTTQTGTRQDLYEKFEKEFVKTDDDSSSDNMDDTEVEEQDQPTVVVKTLDQITKEKEEAKAIKEAEKESKKQAKDAKKTKKDSKKLSSKKSATTEEEPIVKKSVTKKVIKKNN